jgi:precorrin-6B methylase 2
LDLNEGIDLKIFLLSNSERKILNLKKIISSNDYVNFIDCGANIGSTALTLAKFYNKAKIFAIEPTFYAFDKLKKILVSYCWMNMVIRPLGNLTR